MKKSEFHACVLLDRDGVINASVRDGYVVSPEGIRLLPGVGEAIAELNRHGFAVLVISNQQGVAKGVMTPEDLDAVTETVRAGVSAAGGTIAEFFYCTHLAAENCPCRKPKPGLVQQAQARYGFELAQTYLVGDSYIDMETARQAGCPGIFVLSGLDAGRYHAGEPLPMKPAHVAGNLPEAVRYILENAP